MSARTVWAGLLFQLDTGWHIYWRNPGDSGTPPAVNWSVPVGYDVGTIRWPQPARLGSGSVIDYGYKNEVLLMAPIERASAEPGAGAEEIAADVKYVVCSEVCVPGKAHVALGLSSNRRTTPEASRWRRLFARTRAEIPKKAPAQWRVSADLVEVGRQGYFLLSVKTGKPERNATFFPLDAGVIENSAPQVLASVPGGFRLTLQPSDLLTKRVPVLRGLLVFGPRRAFEIAAPVGVVAR